MDFPELYRGRHNPLSASLMFNGADCDDGWFSLIWACHDQSKIVQAQRGVWLKRGLECLNARWFLSLGDAMMCPH